MQSNCFRFTLLAAGIAFFGCNEDNASLSRPTRISAFSNVGGVPVNGGGATGGMTAPDSGGATNGGSGASGGTEPVASAGSTGTAGAGGAGVARVYDDPYVSNVDGTGSFALFASGQAATLVVNTADFAGVIRAVTNLQNDINSVTNVIPTLAKDTVPADTKQVVLIGTVGKSALVSQLVNDGKLDVSGLTGKWETFVVQVVEQPMAGVDRALVIAGSDKRGTIYGIYDLSKHIGVSPWYWWADVPPRQQTALYVTAGTHTLGTPAVKYRGIFINDENPSLLGYASQKFRGFKSTFYDKVFELMSRLKANYLWPAMWGKAFDVDDLQNPVLADEYGIVMGTSHHQPMMRAQKEWTDAGYTSEQWNYDADAAAVRSFWEGGITRMGQLESIVTIGMRGDGDVPLANASISLLQQVVSDQRDILERVTGKSAASTPQVWSLYKEVQEFYDQGMQVPDDVTLLFSDDNWGNLRRLPQVGAAARGGGFGVYYHYDYVGDPRSYKWLNTNPIPRIWEQMHLAYAMGANQMWMVNVGDIKPMEFPIEFFMDYAWNPGTWPADSLTDYTRLWAERQFGHERAAAIADIIIKYTKFNGRRKPELLDPNTYSLTDYQEAETVVSDYNKLADDAQKISDSLPPEAKDAFLQLVLFPVQACANLNDLYVTAAKNALAADQGRATTNDLATRVNTLFNNDATLTTTYHKAAGGKWNHMMDQTHIGYTTWDQPATNVMPTVTTITLPAEAQLGVAIEGSRSWWPNETAEAVLPEFSPYQAQPSKYVDVFNRGQASFSYTATTTVPWVTITPAQGTISTEQRLAVGVDWNSAPPGTTKIPIAIMGPSTSSVIVQAVINNPTSPPADQVKGFIEGNGYVSIEAEHYTNAIATSSAGWYRIPDLGRTLSAMTTFPVTAASQTPGGSAAHLEYNVFLFNSGQVTVSAYVSPTLNFHQSALRYGVSFDDGPIETVDIVEGISSVDNLDSVWSKMVSDNITVTSTSLTVAAPGAHVLKYWMIDPGVVLQKLLVETTGAKPSYLGPPESLLR